MHPPSDPLRPMPNKPQLLISVLALTAVTACAGMMPGAGPSTARWDAAADTTLCVVDRTAPAGLRNIAARIDDRGVILVRDGRNTLSLEQAHPVSIMAGYAGEERWVTGPTPVTHAGRRYIRTGGDRLVPINLLTRVGNYQGVPLFASPDERTAEAVYVPLRPGCVFQAYIREDLL
ncbi:hypothetical protein BH23GEM6_BH23GEM6_00290 [soil metagenome]